ncbi:MAG: MerR family transcriptional regulator [Clostridiales bacterium]|nr:MerR family transcriptional regulator [Clostridiales bacterium]
MENQKYHIGDVADMIGLSRDTIRYYEKRGILSSQKEENGYRFYTDQDIIHLISIIYQRKMDFGLDDIENIWSADDSVNALSSQIEERIEDEMREIRRHQQTIARLRLSQSDYEHIRHDLGQPHRTALPSVYVIEPHTDMDDSIRLWFHYAKEYPGLDMMYTFDEYTWRLDHSRLTLAYQNTCLVLHENLREYAEYPFSVDDMPTRSDLSCVSALFASPTRIPDASLIQPIVEWARSQKLTLSDRIYVTFLTRGKQDGQNLWFLQLYIPVSGSASSTDS